MIRALRSFGFDLMTFTFLYDEVGFDFERGFMDDPFLY